VADHAGRITSAFLFAGKGEAMKREKDQKRKEQIIDNKDKTPEAVPEKSRYKKIIDGEADPAGSEKGYKNLITGQTVYNFKNLPPEKRKEISRKGAAAVQALHGEKKTAREALEKILTLKINDNILAGADLDPEIAQRLKRDNPDATLYDLIQLVAVGRAVGGNIKAAEYVRDTFGDSPVHKVDLQADIMTEADRALLEKVSSRLADPDLVIVKDQTDGSSGSGP